tara:strand:- start:1558 stop:2589 length:1032 start_codon:yes stop_codon:yes gene_type:complete
MGVKIFDLLPSKEIEIKDLNGKIILLDASLVLYQFLSTIRQRDGTPLKDSKGNITSHLVGLFSRTTNLMQQGIKVAFVFDGKSPELKKKEQERRWNLKQEAIKKYEEALAAKDVEGMAKYSSRTSKLTPEMISEAKELISALGLPIIQAPSEAEAQASYMVSKGHAFAIGTQDADSFMFGASRLIKNLTISGKRKVPGKLSYVSIKPELIELPSALNVLGIDKEQLISLCMLIGTDFNPGGIKGIGPKNALKYVKQYEKDFDQMFKDLNWDEFCEFSWNEVYYTIKKIPVSDDYNLEWQEIDLDKLKSILLSHDFSEERINVTAEKLQKNNKDKQQKSLNKWF